MVLKLKESRIGATCGLLVGGFISQLQPPIFGYDLSQFPMFFVPMVVGALIGYYVGKQYE